MTTKDNSQSNDFLESLKYESAQPDQEFKQTLRNQVIREYRGKGSIFGIQPKFIGLGLASLAIFILIGGGIGLQYLQQNGVDKNVETLSLASSSDKSSEENILDQLEGPGTESMSLDYKTETENLGGLDEAGGNYIYYQFDVQTGSAFDSCLLGLLDIEGRIELSQYTESEAPVATKLIYYDSEDAMQWEYLMTEDGTSKKTYDPGISINEMNDINHLLLAELVSGDYGLEPAVEKNGTVTVTSQYAVSCASGSSATVIKEAAYNQENLDLQEVSVYLESKGEENILFKAVNYSIESKSVEFEKVKGEFE